MAGHHAAVLVAPPGQARPRACRWSCSTAWAKVRKFCVTAAPAQARSATARVASTLGEQVGDCGLRCASGRRFKRTRVVVTRRLHPAVLDDPFSMACRSAVRRIPRAVMDADLGLALARRATGLAPGSEALVMSATLDGAALQRCSAMHRWSSEGRAYPVETRYLGVGEPQSRSRWRRPPCVRCAVRALAARVFRRSRRNPRTETF